MSGQNINASTKKRQNLLALLIFLGLSAVGGGIYYANYLNNSKADPKPEFDEKNEVEPDLTGAMGNTFEGQVSSQLLTDLQTDNKANREAMNAVLEKLKSVEELLDEQKKDNEALRKRIEENERVHNDFISAVANQPDPQPSPVNEQYVEPKTDQGVTATRGKTKPSAKTQSNYQVQDGYVELSHPKPVKGAFERKTYSKKSNGSSSSGSFYVPSGSFANAIILEGADANASVTAQQNDITPMQFKLTGKLHQPNNKRSTKLVGCFVTAGTYGDISSERAIVRLERLSCLINGKYIDQKVKGHVAFYGKNGIKGVPVMRNGKILGLAFASGALSGVGGAVSAVGDTQAGLGAARAIGGAEVLREALGGGTTTAANKLADYYIQRAEQYHPVIPIGSANRVEVVFTEGFWAKFVENEEEQSVEETPKNEQAESNAASQQNQHIVPKELENQLGEISNQNLSDFVTPNQPIK